MTLRSVVTLDAPATSSGSTPVSRFGHDHFWRRASMSRRQFMMASGASAAGVALATTALGRGGVAFAEAEDEGAGTPRPIPQFITVPFAPGKKFHVQMPGSGAENSTIGDFNGVVGVTELQGMGTANDGTRLPFDVDMRFMTGEFVGLRGRHHHGTFGFV